MLKSLPVPLYHYISAFENPISVHPEIFEDHLKAMNTAGFKGIGMDEAEEYLINGRELPKKSVLLSFDDGFLDNFVYAYPMLKKYGHKAVIFAVTGKLAEEKMQRPTLEDVWEGQISPQDLPRVDQPYAPGAMGFMSRKDLFITWHEARLLEQSGVMRVEGHSHHHRSVFTGPRYKGYFRPGPRKRTFDRVDAEIIPGLPRFTVGPALAEKAFIPSEKLYDLVRSVVPQDPKRAYDFFEKTDGTSRLDKELAKLPKDQWGQMETTNDYKARVKQELTLCKQALDKNLGRPARVLAWPWGACTPDSVVIAKGVGFEALFVTSVGPNPPGKPASVHRFKARNKKGSWLVSRLSLYSSPIKARTYSLFRK